MFPKTWRPVKEMYPKISIFSLSNFTYEETAGFNIGKRTTETSQTKLKDLLFLSLLQRWIL